MMIARTGWLSVSSRDVVMSASICRPFPAMVATIAALLAMGRAVAEPSKSPATENHADDQRIAALVRDLDANEYAVREAASDDLLKIGEPAIPAIKDALQLPPSLEVRSRCERLVRTIILWGDMPHELSLPSLMKFAKTVGASKDPEAACRDANLDKLVECWVRVLGQVSGQQDCRPPVRLGDVKSAPVEVHNGSSPDRSNSLLVVNRGHLGTLDRCMIFAEGPIDIDVARDCVIIGRSVVNVDHCQNCVIIAGFLVDGSQASSSFLVGGAQVHFAQATGSVVAAGLDLSIELAVHVVLVNSRLEGECQQVQVTNAPLPELRLSDIAAANPMRDRVRLIDTLWEGDIVAKIRVDGGSERTIHPGDSITGVDGKPISGLEHWKLAFANRGAALFVNDKDFAVLRVHR
jgi:hypothetical protein